MDYGVFEDAGRLLYEGSFVAERVSGVREWYDAHPAPTNGEEDALLPEIRSIYDAAAKSFTAVDAWNDLRKQMMGQRAAAREFAKGFQVRRLLFFLSFTRGLDLFLLAGPRRPYRSIPSYKEGIPSRSYRSQSQARKGALLSSSTRKFHALPPAN